MAGFSCGDTLWVKNWVEREKLGLGRQGRANSGRLNKMEMWRVWISWDASGTKVGRARKIGHWSRQLGYWILRRHWQRSCVWGQGRSRGLRSGSWRMDIRAVGAEEGTGCRENTSWGGRRQVGTNALAQWTLKPTSRMVGLSLIYRISYEHFWFLTWRRDSQGTITVIKYLKGKLIEMELIVFYKAPEDKLKD